MEFVAIDVETANASMASICQVGIAAFDSSGVVDEWVTLVDPEDFFDDVNMFIHGITPEDVVGAPTLPTAMSQIRVLLDGQVVVCHTHFDRVSIRQGCARYGLDTPACTWLDSARVTRRTWQQFAATGYGLQNVCAHIGYEYEAHDALEDAKAAGAVLLAAIAETGLSVEDWLGRVERPIGAAQGAASVSREGKPDGPFFGEVMIFTGALRVPRREAADLAAAAGCSVSDSITKNTTILVVGDQDIAKLAGHVKSSKHRKAEALIQQGHPIRIIGESDFLDMVSAS